MSGRKEILVIWPHLRQVFAHQGPYRHQPAYTVRGKIVFGPDQPLVIPKTKGNHNLLVPVLRQLGELIDAMCGVG
jgi:hypothetical protein